jgi:ribosome modulation factor
MTNEDYFQDGLDAYGRGVTRRDCPFPEGDNRRETWLDGWDEAKDAATNEEVTDNV